jgi:hypothetical protein
MTNEVQQDGEVPQDPTPSRSACVQKNCTRNLPKKVKSSWIGYPNATWKRAMTQALQNFSGQKKVITTNDSAPVVVSTHKI